MQQSWLDPGPFLGVLDVELEHRSHLGGRALRRLVFENPRAAAHHLGERPVGDTVTVREAAAPVPPDVSDEAVDVLLEFPGEPGLPDARNADDGHEAGT